MCIDHTQKQLCYFGSRLKWTYFNLAHLLDTGNRSKWISFISKQFKETFIVSVPLPRFLIFSSFPTPNICVRASGVRSPPGLFWVNFATMFLSQFLPTNACETRQCYFLKFIKTLKLLAGFILFSTPLLVPMHAINLKCCP